MSGQVLTAALLQGDGGRLHGGRYAVAGMLVVGESAYLELADAHAPVRLAIGDAQLVDRLLGMSPAIWQARLCIMTRCGWWQSCRPVPMDARSSRGWNLACWNGATSFSLFELATLAYAATNRNSVISAGAPMRFGGPQ